MIDVARVDFLNRDGKTVVTECFIVRDVLDARRKTLLRYNHVIKRRYGDLIGAYIYVNGEKNFLYFGR